MTLTSAALMSLRSVGPGGQRWRASPLRSAGRRAGSHRHRGRRAPRPRRGRRPTPQAPAGAPAPSVEHVHELVREQRVTDRRAGFVGTGRERDVLADGEGARAGQLGGARAGVDADMRQVGAERAAHAAANGRLERAPGADCARARAAVRSAGAGSPAAGRARRPAAAGSRPFAAMPRYLSFRGSWSLSTGERQRITSGRWRRSAWSSSRSPSLSWPAARCASRPQRARTTTPSAPTSAPTRQLAVDLSENGRYGGPESGMRRSLHWPLVALPGDADTRSITPFALRARPAARAPARGVALDGTGDRVPAARRLARRRADHRRDGDGRGDRPIDRFRTAARDPPALVTASQIAWACTNPVARAADRARAGALPRLAATRCVARRGLAPDDIAGRVAARAAARDWRAMPVNGYSASRAPAAGPPPARGSRRPARGRGRAAAGTRGRRRRRGARARPRRSPQPSRAGSRRRSAGRCRRRRCPAR